MFDIDDNFLASIGYDVAALPDDEKDQYKQEITEELQTRLSERLGAELEDYQVDDFDSIQNGSDRATQWLYEFHSDFEQQDDYKKMVAAMGEPEAKIFYASALWMQDAVPNYGIIVRDEFDKYQQELVQKREMVNKAFGV